MQFLSNLSKITPNLKSWWYCLIEADVISFFVGSEGKKIQKIDENN